MSQVVAMGRKDPRVSGPSSVLCLSSLIGRQTVAVAMNRMDEPWTVGVRLDLLTQAGNRVVDRPCVGGLGVAPHLPQQLGPRHHASRALRQVPKQFELTMGERDRPGALHRLQRSKIHCDPPELEALDLPPRAAQDCMDARNQLLQVERLGDVVVGTQTQPAELVALLAACRQDHNWRLSSSPEYAAELEAGLTGEHQIKQDQ